MWNTTPRCVTRLERTCAASCLDRRTVYAAAAVDYERLYSYRFRDVPQDDRVSVWGPIAAAIYERMDRPQVLLDPAAGRCEFINAAPAPERWAIDMQGFPPGTAAKGINELIGDVFEVELPESHFDGVFVSNFLEHLHTPEDVSRFLERMRGAMTPGGRIAIMGPNYRYCAKVYWDYADHWVALTHNAIEEHLYAAGFEPRSTIPRFLPYSFNGRLPASPRLTELYLKTPLAWRLLGKQFLVIAEA